MSWGHGWWGTGAWGTCAPDGPDMQAPQVLNQVPAPGATNVISEATVSFRISDGVPDSLHTGVDYSSIRVLITRNAVTDVAMDIVGIRPAYAGPRSLVLSNAVGGFDVRLDPVVPWEVGSTISVAIEGYDGNCNPFSVAWSFSVGACTVETCTALDPIVVPSVGQWGVGQWGVGAWGGRGPSTLLTSDAGVPAIVSLSPALGSASGGEAFVLHGANLASFDFNDIFSDASVSPSLWTQIGAGSLAETPYGLGGTLHCVAPATAGVMAGVMSKALALRTDFHVEVEFLLESFVPPSSEILLAALEAWYDPLNFIALHVVQKGPPNFERLLRCQVWKSGSLAHLFETPTSSERGRLGLMRYFDSVYNDNRALFIVDGTQIFESFDCPPCKMACRFFVANQSSGSAINTWFDNFKSHSVVVFTTPFSSRPASGIVEVSSSKLRGKIPESTWAGPVEIRVTNGSGNGCFDTCAECFGYFYPDGFVIGRTDPYRPTRKELSILNDPVLRNPTLNIGHGLRRQG